MNPERWREVERLFEQVADLPPEQRQQALLDADPEIRSEVLSLLAHDRATLSSVHASVRDGAQAVARAAVSTWIGRRIGPWRVTGTLGQGGMGTVLEAVRDDDQYKQKAAIKLVKREMDSGFARRRFVQERQILAALEHPAIARLLDGGSTEDGLPYLVMEFIEGRDILAYAAEHNLSVEDRLRLFRDVLGAVAFAHQKLVVHRDLKPSNILVTADGKPKLLDFGIARLLEPDLLESAPLQTATSAGLMTPDYASPEQVRGEPVVPASDIYSLGAILYELLTGVRAHQLSTYSAAEIVTAVCTAEKRRPSAVAPEKLRRKLAGDLDVVVMTALHRDPARRYQSAEAFAGDIGRTLSHRPVLARPDSLRYRAAKFVRRNRVAVAAAVLVASSLTAGLIVTLKAERRAQARFNQVRKLATTFLFEFDRDIRQLPGATAARETLVKTATEQLDSLARDAADDPGLMYDLAAGYQNLADVLGSPTTPSLGHTDRAIEAYRKACALSRQLVGRYPSTDTRYRALACTEYSRLGYLLYHSGNESEARQRMLEGIAWLQPRIDSGKAEAPDYRAGANAHGYLATLERQAYHTRIATGHAVQAVDFMRKYQALTPGLRARSDLGRSLLVAGGAAMSSGDLPRAEALLQEAISLRSAILVESPNDVENRRELAITELFLANVEHQPEGPSLGHQAVAAAARSEYVRLLRELVDSDARNVAFRHSLALALKEVADGEADSRRAEAALREALRVLEAMPATFRGRDRHIGLMWAALGGLLRRNGRNVEARAALAEAPRWFAHENPADAMARGDFLRLWQEQGDYARIWEALSPSMEGAREDIAVAYDLASCALKLAKAHPESAVSWTAKAVELWAPWKGRYPTADRQLGF